MNVARENKSTKRTVTDPIIVSKFGATPKADNVSVNYLDNYHYQDIPTTFDTTDTKDAEDYGK